jgi:hypothetical protein
VAAVRALDDDGVRKSLLELGSVIPPAAERSPEALAALVKNEIIRWTPVLKPADHCFPAGPELGPSALAV